MVNMRMTQVQASDLAFILRAFKGEVDSKLVGSFLIQEEVQDLLDALREGILLSDVEES